MRVASARAHRYFDFAGAAEKIRLACAVGKVPFTDVRIKFDQWPSLKPSAKFGQMPLLEVDGEQFAQSTAILTYVGKLGGLYPSDPKKALAVDEVVGLHDDVAGALRPSFMVMRDPKLSKKEAQRKQLEMRKDLCDTKLPELFSYYEKLLDTNNSGWFVGDAPTIADVAVFSQLRFISSGVLDGIPKGYVESTFPKLKAFCDQAGDLPEVKKWYADANSTSKMTK